MLPSNMARTGAPSTNTLEIGRVLLQRGRAHEARLLSNHALLDMEPERCRGEMQMRITFVSSHHTQITQ